MHKITNKKHKDHLDVLMGRFRNYLGYTRMKDIQPWTHLSANRKNKTTLEVETTTCGKTSRSCDKTNVMDHVSCPRCLDIMKQDNWYCSEHGFIADANVTFEETCVLCGKPVAW